MNTHYRHFRRSLLQKDHTFCGVVNTAGHLMIGLAVCNPKDMFEKKLGRETSYSAAHLTPVATLAIPDGEYSGHVFHEFINNFYHGSTFHKRVAIGEVIEFV